jgi:membrane protease YdiL (CAAX protease family)
MKNWQRMDRWLFVFALIGLVVYGWMAWSDPALREPRELSREQAIAKAAEAWQRMGTDVGSWQATAVLEGEEEVTGYLIKERLEKDFEQKAPPKAALVYWRVVFEKDASVRYVARVDSKNGDLLGFERKGESEPVEVERAEAERMALRELEQLGISTSRLTKGAGDADEAGRYSFVFSDAGLDVKGVQLKYHVLVAGSRVTKITYEYEVPESFRKWKEQQQSIGSLLTILSFLFTFVMFVLAVVYLFLVKQKKPWLAALLLTVLIFGLFVVSNLNMVPAFDPELSDNPIERMLQSTFAKALVILLSFVVAISTYPAILTGGTLVREIKPGLWVPWNSPDWPSRMKLAVWRGYMLAVLWLVLQSIFYVVSTEWFGVWGEQDFSMTPSNTLWPALFPLMGWLAGVQEELFFRLFGVTFFKRYWKSTLLATLLPAMVWALGHSLYPVYPIYTRFIELTLFGVVIGYCYWWLGLETVIMAHVIFDLVQMVFPLFFAGEPVEVAAGVGFLVSPIFVGYGLIWVRNRLKLERKSNDFV